VKLDSAFLSLFSESFGQRALPQKYIGGSGASITQPGTGNNETIDFM